MKNSNLPRNFVLQLGSLVTLYISLIFIIVLALGLIDILIPDAADDIWQINNNSERLRISMAMVIVFFPTYLVLTRYVNKIRRKEEQGMYLTLTKWLIYLSLLLGGLILLGDLVAVIISFLGGEITLRFIFKALAVLIVIGMAFKYYLKDAQNYWVGHEKQSKIYGVVAGAIVLATVVTGLLSIQSPQEVRERRFDERQIQNLQMIQGEIQNHLRINNELPASLDELQGKSQLPEAPKGRPAYEYNLIEGGFELCATFATESIEDQYYGYSYPLDRDSVIFNPDDWRHSEGRECFERKVNINQTKDE